jgi:hypothetical protein
MAIALDLFKICPVDQQILNDALKLGLPDFEDAVQITCAVASKLDVIITRNPKDFQTTAISIMTANQLIKYLR